MHILHSSCQVQRTIDGLSVSLSTKCMNIQLIHCHFLRLEVVDQMVCIVVASAKNVTLLPAFVKQDYLVSY